MTQTSSRTLSVLTTLIIVASLLLVLYVNSVQSLSDVTTEYTSIIQTSLIQLNALILGTPEQINSLKQGTHNPYYVFNNWINELFYKYSGLASLSVLIYDKLGSHNGYYAACYIRDLFLGTMVYWGTAAVWHIAIYHVYRDQLFTKNNRPLPTTETILNQMKLAQASLIVYAALPIFSEFLIESNYTKVYFYINELNNGWVDYFLYLFLYIAAVEVGIYWMHRTLHTNKFLFTYVHGLHHQYKSDATLTPWASLAFNPIDGILQASPYVFFLLFIPVHYFTHVFLLFFSGVWATNIHDALWSNSEPLMGSKYHTIHHTLLVYNYGQFFTFCDAFWGTLRVPAKTTIYGGTEAKKVK